MSTIGFLNKFRKRELQKFLTGIMALALGLALPGTAMAQPYVGNDSSGDTVMGTGDSDAFFGRDPATGDTVFGVGGAVGPDSSASDQNKNGDTYIISPEIYPQWPYQPPSHRPRPRPPRPEPGPHPWR